VRRADQVGGSRRQKEYVLADLSPQHRSEGEIRPQRGVPARRPVGLVESAVAGAWL
jgi:hypothetical protein